MNKTLHQTEHGIGWILAVSSDGRHRFSKQPRSCIHLLAGEGVDGDAHCGTAVQHLYLKRRDPRQPNLAQVHLFPSEMLGELAGKGFALGAGDLGENVLTAGFDPLALPLGTRLHLGREAMVEVTGLRTPCAKMDGLRPGLQQHLWGPRDLKGKRASLAGIMSVVLASGAVETGDSISVAYPPEPHLPLGPV